MCVGPPWKLARIRDFQIREELTEAQIPRGNHLAADPRDGIWLGTTRGELVRFHHGTVEKFFLNEKSNSGSPRIVAAEGGLVLAGFNDGLVGWRDSKVQRMSTRNGLPCDQIFSFLEDREQRWWLYTDCGVVELPDSELQRWWANPETVVQTRLYDVLDGARPGGYAFFNAGAYSPDGRVWFANGSAVQMLDPSQLSQRALRAMTYIESVSVDRKELAGTANLRLAPHPRDLQIDYTSPSFLIPQRIKFRYRLDGYDQDWHDVGTRRQAFYTDLPPGSFSFRVIACNSDGVWNDSGAKLDFSIAPAYYQTNWFRAFCVA
ncbi:MAG TPA: triple tyrosine motif-containing protein, partial [Candidatus Bathyarchaeia archaeon]|nr:triple tyrosine motif-containing protein [Candidatus Bathyarchaeia archaeon]